MLVLLRWAALASIHMLCATEADQCSVNIKLSGKMHAWQGAEQLSANEHFLNVYCSKKARDSIADFLGYCDVPSSPEHSGRRRNTHHSLTPGNWLVSIHMPYYLADVLRAYMHDHMSNGLAQTCLK